METLYRDIRFGFRTFLKQPGFTVIAVAALALGIGANTAIFSVVNAVLLRSLPYKNADRLTVLQMVNQTTGKRSSFVSFPNLQDWRSQGTSFSDIVAFLPGGFTLTGFGDAERLDGGRVSASFFDLLEVSPILGRSFLPGEDKPGSDRVALIGESLWKRRFGGEPSIIGRPLNFNGQAYTIVGVVPGAFKSPLRAESAEVWVTIAYEGQNLTERGAVVTGALGKLKPGVSLEKAQLEMDAISTQLENDYPAANRNFGVKILGLQDSLVGDSRTGLLILFAAVGVVLLIACSNVANLLLAKATTRQREVAIRSAIGASPWRLVRQLLTESVLLALFSGAAGLFLAWWGIDLILAFTPEDLPRLNTINIDGRVLGFTLVTALLTGLVFGMAPALRAARTNLTETLKDGGRGSTTGGSSQFLRSVLVVGEVALTFVLLVGASLLIGSFWKLTSVSPGFNAENIITARISVPRAKYPDNPSRVKFYHDVLERLSQVPGVKSVAFANTPPFGTSSVFAGIRIEGTQYSPGQEPNADITGVTTGYFDTLGIHLLSGRGFSERDDLTTPGVAIVNEAFVRSFFGTGEALGTRFTTGVTVDDNEPPTWEIIGVAPDLKYIGLDRDARPQVYMPHRQMAWGWGRLLVRADRSASALGATIRSEVLSVDPEQPVYDLRTLDEMIAGSVSRQKFNTMLLVVFALLGLLLALVGVYGVISFTVTEATHDIGVRVALGAQARDILRLVIGRGLILAVIGIALGAIGGVAVTRLMASLLYQVSPTDPATFLGVGAALVTVGILASAVPARRAMRVDPIVALRYE